MTPARPPRSRDLAWRLVREHLAAPGALALALAGGLGLAAARLRLTWLLKACAEGPVAHRDPQMLAGLLTEAALLLGAAVAGLLLSRGQLARLHETVGRRLREQVHAALLHTDLAHRRAAQEGDLVSRVASDVPAAGGVLALLVKRHLSDGAVVLGGTVLLFVLDWRLALLAGALVPACGLLLHRVSRRLREAGGHAQAALGALNATLSEQLAGLTTIKGLQTEAAEAARFAARVREDRRRRVRGEAWAALVVAAVWLATGLTLLALVWAGAGAVLSGRLTPGGLLAFTVYATQALEPLRRLGEAHAALQLSLGAAARVYAVVDLPAESWPGTADPQPRPTSGVAVRIEGLHFAYGDGREVLRGVDLAIAAGERVGVVGSTGAGKSTLGWMLAGFFPASAGVIRLDGVDVRGLSLGRLRRDVCLVEQEPFVFGGTLLDNLRYGAADAPEEVVAAAVEDVGLGPLARERGGLRAALAEGGRDLSSGQRQRLALARALLREPRLLVLDEALSALDGEAEQALLDRLEGWLSSRTVLVISHRLASVARCGRVAVLAEGVVRAEGPVAEVLGPHSPLARLFAGQDDPGRPAA